MGGQMVKGRYVIKQVSPDKYTWTWDMSFGSGGGAWRQVAEGTDTGIKKVPGAPVETRPRAAAGSARAAGSRSRACRRRPRGAPARRASDTCDRRCPHG